MKRLFASTLAGILLISILLLMPKVNGAIALFALRMIFWPAFSISWSWAGLDCPNADCIADKLTCIGISVAVDVIAYSALFCLILWLVDRTKRLRASKVTGA